MRKIIAMFLISSMGIFTPVLQAEPRHGGHYRPRHYHRHRGHYRGGPMRSGDWGVLAAFTGAVIIGSAIASSSDNSYDRELNRRERELQRRERQLRDEENNAYYNNSRTTTRTTGRRAKVIYSDGRTQILEMADGTRITVNQ